MKRAISNLLRNMVSILDVTMPHLNPSPYLLSLTSFFSSVTCNPPVRTVVLAVSSWSCLAHRFQHRLRPLDHCCLLHRHEAAGSRGKITFSNCRVISPYMEPRWKVEQLSFFLALRRRICQKERLSE